MSQGTSSRSCSSLCSPAADPLFFFLHSVFLGLKSLRWSTASRRSCSFTSDEAHRLEAIPLNMSSLDGGWLAGKGLYLTIHRFYRTFQGTKVLVLFFHSFSLLFPIATKHAFSTAGKPINCIHQGKRTGGVVFFVLFFFFQTCHTRERNWVSTRFVRIIPSRPNLHKPRGRVSWPLITHAFAVRTGRPNKSMA